MKKKYFLALVFLTIAVVFLLIQSSKPTTQEVGAYILTEATTGQLLGRACQYTVVYRGKTIRLGEYSSILGCKTSQSVIANSMLAIAAEKYTFFYDPTQKKVLTLDPDTIKTFKDFSSSRGINISDYSTRRYFLNASNWQVWYQKTSRKPIIFTTKNAGKTFAFDGGEQQ